MSIPRVFIAGHQGMVGSAIFSLLKKKKITLITKDKKNLNLLNQSEVEIFFKTEKIDQVYLSAAKVGGIYANETYPAQFIYENLTIQSNIIHSAFLAGVKKLLFLGSSCIYPKFSKQPIKEEELLSGKLEPSNEPYAIAKIAGIKMCESYNRQYHYSHNIDYRSIMPTNLYGPGDNYHDKNGHVIPSLIKRFHEAKVNNLEEVKIWGTGNPKREFLYVDDMASACVYLMNLDKKTFNKYTSPMCSHVNVGSGEEINIKNLAEIIKEITNFKGKIYFDKSKPDGTPRKFLSSERMNSLGFKPKISLIEGLSITYQEYLNLYKDKEI